MMMEASPTASRSFGGTLITRRAAQSESIGKHLNPISIVKHLWDYRDLIEQFTRREVEGRYKGSFLGLFWSFLSPLVMLVTYTFVFGVIFKSRWRGVVVGSFGEFALILFSGFLVFNVFCECVSRAPTLILGVPNYVKKVVFPLEILPVAVLGCALFHALVSLTVVLIGNLVINHTVCWTLLFLPLVWLPLCFLTVGFSWFLAGLGVYLRDISYTVTLATQVLIFITPIFYPIEIIPAPFRTIVKLNPLTWLVQNSREVVLWGGPPRWGEWALWSTITLGLAMFGYGWFMRTKRGFADVI